jgi:hypothetical protein
VNEMKPRQWFQARLRWAVLEEGRGLAHWREAEHIFISEDRETAFQEALRIGYAGEYSFRPAPDQRRLRASTAGLRKWSIWKNWGWGERHSRYIWEKSRPAKPSDAITSSIRRHICRPPFCERRLLVTTAFAAP